MNSVPVIEQDPASSPVYEPPPPPAPSTPCEQVTVTSTTTILTTVVVTTKRPESAFSSPSSSLVPLPATSLPPYPIPESSTVLSGNSTVPTGTESLVSSTPLGTGVTTSMAGSYTPVPTATRSAPPEFTNAGEAARVPAAVLGLVGAAAVLF